MLNYNVFYKELGVRRKNDLLTGNPTTVTSLELPKNSIVHWMPEDDRVGPKKTDSIYNGNYKSIYLSHVLELKGVAGEPRFIADNYLAEVKSYHHQNPKINWLKKDISLIGTTDALIAVSYTGLRKQYVYRPNLQSVVDSFHNRYQTMFDVINDQTGKTERQHFIMIDIPETIPGILKFNEATKALSTTLIKVFKSEDALFCLEMWKWLGESPETSIINQLTIAAQNQVNLVFMIRNKATIVNLGLMRGWKKPIGTEEGDKAGFAPDRYQKNFLGFLIKSAAPDREIVKVTKVPVLGVVADTSTGQEEDDDVDIEEPMDFDEMDKEIDLHNEIVVEEDPDEAEIVLETDDVEQALQEAVPYSDPNITVSEKVANQTRVMAESGLISIPEMQRYTTLSNRYKTLPNPFGEGTVADLMVIDPKLLKLDAPTEFVDQETVLDKSMLQSTLDQFDQRYIKNVLHRDVTNFVMQLQNTGVLVTDFRCEEVEDAMNHYQIYTVSVEPIGGKASTFKLEIPVVDKDGVMLSGGVKYFLKKQHGELPIRKVSPRRVSLTSYYGKIFVDRNKNVSMNYTTWINNQLSLIGTNPDNPRVEKLRAANSFNHRIVLPRIYTTLAQRYKSFTVNFEDTVFDISLDYDGRFHLFGEDAVKAVEANGRIVMGKTKKGLLTVNAANELVLVTGTKEYPLPKFEEFVGMPLEKMPLEAAMVNLFGSNIPLIVMLGYRLGMSRLLKTLGVKYRRVDSGKTLNLQPDEYRVRFKNESWIFSRKDEKAALVIGGLNVMHQQIKEYNSNLFDKKDVYINLMDSLGLGIRYIKEMDLIYDMFVDHITREMLIEMDEPTDVILLLLRAVDLLLVDYYPDEGDKRFMRIKGYERIGGTVYLEIIKALRQRQGSTIHTKATLEINPKAAKMGILTDSSKEVLNEINPIHDLKQKEIVTFGGTGGRSTKTMVKRTRAYHETDMGVISEATVDSGDVGIISYMSAVPKFNSLRGTTNRYDFDKDGLSSLLSTSALISPAAENDDHFLGHFDE